MATAPITADAAPRSGVRRWIWKLRSGDEIARLVTLLFALSVVLLTAMLVLRLWAQSATARQTFGWTFLISRVWDPVAGQFGALPFVYGTLVTSLVALVIAVPLGLGAAIFLAELAPRRLSDALTF